MKKIMISLMVMMASIFGICTGVFANDTVAMGGIVFEVPDGYEYSSENSKENFIQYDGENSAIVILKEQTPDKVKMKKLKKKAKEITNEIGKKINISEIDTFKHVDVADIDSLYYKGESGAWVLCGTCTYVPENDAVVYTILIKTKLFETEEEDDYIEMLEDAEFDEYISDTKPKEEMSYSDALALYGNMLSEYGQILDNVDKGNYGDALGGLANMYGQLGELYGK